MRADRDELLAESYDSLLAAIRLWSVYLDVPGITLELRESFPVWMLRHSAIVSAVDVQLSNRAEFTGMWHHQIWFDGHVGAFARSVVTASGEQVLVRLAKSSLGDKIESALAAAERAGSSEGQARLLELPTFAICSLWLVGSPDEKVFVASKPERNTMPVDVAMDGLTFVRRVREQNVDSGFHAGL